MERGWFSFCALNQSRALTERVLERVPPSWLHLQPPRIAGPESSYDMLYSIPEYSVRNLPY